MSISPYLYVPVIKSKLNDLKAIAVLSSRARTLVKPLLDVMPVPKNTSVDDHLDKFLKNFIKHCPERPIFLDLYGLMPSAALENGKPAVPALYHALKKRGRVVTPTYGFQRDDALWPAFRTVVRDHDRGFCFRIDEDDLDDAAEDTWTQIFERSAELGLSPSEVDLLIDLRDVSGWTVAALKNRVLDFLSHKPVNAHFRTIGLLGSSALKTVVDIEKDSDGPVERLELKLWLQIQLDVGDSLQLTYGDYGVVHPDFSDGGSTKYANAKIRYTAGENIVYFRGHALREPPKYLQYHDLAERVRSSPFYRGRGFSFGDEYVDECADRRASTGNLGTWVIVDMNHHIEYVALQIDRLRTAVETQPAEEEVEELMALA